MNLAAMTAGQLKGLLNHGETSCVEIMRSVLDQIERREPSVQAFITVRDETELLQEYLDEKWDKRLDEDMISGRLDKLWEKAKADIATGRVKPLEAHLNGR
jgi:Asp-tRNA(Asn)/Glu-tRNA(Gln) amidotransferase A subunit family amidase